MGCRRSPSSVPWARRADVRLAVFKARVEALVQGDVSGETLRIQRETGEIEGTSELLTSAQIQALAKLAVQIESLFGTPQDIEFALAERRDAERHILQTFAAARRGDDDIFAGPRTFAGRLVGGRRRVGRLGLSRNG